MATIKLDPALLTSQSQQMNALAGEYQNLFSSVVATLKSMDECWSEVLSANFSGKITTAQNSFSNVTELLQQGAQAAQLAATTFGDVDAALANVMNGNGGGSSSGGDSSSSSEGKGGIWQQFKDYFKDSWDKAGNAFKYLEELYGKLPEGVRNAIDKLIYATMGGSGKAAIQITGDILTGDLSWDTLKTALKAMGADSTTISVIMNGGQVIFENETIKMLGESMWNHFSEAGAALVNGDIGGCIENLTTALGENVAQAGYFIAEVSTEVVADIWDGSVGRITDKITGFADLAAEGLNAIGCETIGNAVSAASDFISGAVDSIGGFFRGLVK